MRTFHLFIILLAGTVFSACSPGTLVKESQDVQDGVWTYADSLQFQVAIEDTSRLYDISLLVKHDKSYAYQNLYVKVHTRFPSGKILSPSVSLEVADKSGQWLGKGSGKTCRVEIPIQQNAYFEEKGVYTFTLEQYMRVDSLPGIRSIGLHVRDIGPKRDK